MPFELNNSCRCHPQGLLPHVAWGTTPVMVSFLAPLFLGTHDSLTLALLPLALFARLPWVLLYLLPLITMSVPRYLPEVLNRMGQNLPLALPMILSLNSLEEVRHALLELASHYAVVVWHRGLGHTHARIRDSLDYSCRPVNL